MIKFFFHNDEPNEKQLETSRRLHIIENAIAAIIYSAATSNFLTGYLTQLGASINLCAIVTMIPQLGCVLQFFAPFWFERLKERKKSIWFCCLFFRLSVSLCFLAPIFISGATAKLIVVIALYFIGFMSAGFVTPGLTHLVLSVAPKAGNGRYFARRNIVSACTCSIAMPILGRTVDYFISVDKGLYGYFIIGALCLILTIADLAILGRVYEVPAKNTVKIRLKNVTLPFKDKNYRPFLAYNLIAGLTGGIAAPFLMIYQLYVLNLSHTFITSAGVLASIVGIVGTWFWGRFSEHLTWAKMFMMTAGTNLFCTLMWAFVPINSARVVAPIIMLVTSACAGGAGIANMNLQYESSPEDMKTTYIAITSGCASILSSFSATIGASINSFIEPIFAEKSIPVLFLISGICGLINLTINGRRLLKQR